MAGKKFLTKTFDPETEDLFDYMKEFASERLSEDLFQDEPDVVLCEVLKVFEVSRNTKHYDWVDSIIPGRGRKSSIICFKGRILSRTGNVHAHSNLPNPRWMPGADGGGDAASKQSHWWIDLHPTFVGRSKEGKTPSIGEIVTVEFVKGYTSAAGEWCGIFKDFYEASLGPNGLISEEIDPKKPFGPDARLDKPAQPVRPPKIPFDIPKRILLIGDEIFGAKSTRINVDTAFAGTIKSYIAKFYDMIWDHDLKGVMTNFDIPKKQAQELILRMQQQEINATTEGNFNSDSMVRHLEVEFFNASTAYVDGTFYSNSGKDLYSSEAREERAKELSEMLDISLKAAKRQVPPVSPPITYTQPWKTGSEAKKKIKSDSGSKVLKEVLKSKNSRGQPFDFAIIGGPVGQSTVPGWGGELPNAPDDWKEFYFALVGYDTGNETRRDWEFRSYTRQVARHLPDLVRKEKRKHFEEILDAIFKGGSIKGAVWVGPPLMVGRGKESLKTSKGKGIYEDQTEYHGGIGQREQTVGFKTIRRYHGKYIRAPWYDNNYDVRLQSSLAIKDVIESKGEGKVYPCLAYCTKDFGLDSQMRSQAISDFKEHGKGHMSKLTGFNVKARINNKVYSRANRDAYAKWIVRNLAMYILGIPATQIKMDEKAAQPANADEEEMRIVARFEADRVLIKRIWNNIMTYYETPDEDFAKAIGRVSSLISDQHWDNMGSLEFDF
jgi:hypothetical protein